MFSFFYTLYFIFVIYKIREETQRIYILIFILINLRNVMNYAPFSYWEKLNSSAESLCINNILHLSLII